MNFSALSRCNVIRFLVVICIVLVIHSANGQGTSDNSDKQRIIQCFNQKEFDRAITLIDEYLKNSPNDVEMLYNLTCAYCLAENFDAAATSLHRAIQAGFRDFALLRSDPDLSALRDHPIYKKILEEADKLAIRDARNSFDAWRKTYGGDHYTYETDTERKIHYATSLNPRLHKKMKQRLKELGDHLAKSLFEETPNYFVFIAVPTKRDARRIFESDESASGIYEHKSRRLIAADTGMSLQHEFVHLMHYGHMERLGQRHAFWIQEGLATLFEKYEVVDGNNIRFLQNERDTIARNRVRAKRAMPWKELFNMPAEEFMANARRLYPEVRSIFRYFAERQLIESWYSSYVSQHELDATGISAIEHVFARPLDQVEKEWRQWVLSN